MHLEEKCGIKNPFDKKKELSTTYVYQAIETFGSVKEFYNHFFITSICPIGFMKDGKNFNYYDERSAQEALKPFIVETIEKQIKFGIHTHEVLCLGEGKNYKYLQKLNKEHEWFKKITPLAHPRYVLQYKRKQLDNYLATYQAAFERLVSSIG